MNLTKIIQSILAVSFVVISVSAFAMTEENKNSMMERLTPTGSVCMAGNPKCAVAVSTEPRSGSAVYDAACGACHNSGAAGAPKMGDKAAWASRLGKGKSALYKSAINGIGAMPAKGGCSSCSDDEIKSAIDFMIGKSK